MTTRLEAPYIGQPLGWAPQGALRENGPYMDPNYIDYGGFDPARAPAPKYFKVTMLGSGGFKVEWQPVWGGRFTQKITAYHVHFCPVSLVGKGSGDPLFKDKVLLHSRSIGHMAGQPNGIVMSLTFNDQTLVDGYIQVVGHTANDEYGLPTEPFLLDNNSVTSGPGGDVWGVAAAKVAVTSPHGDQLIRIDYSWRGPTEATFGNFYAMHLHIAGYMGTSVVRCVGPMDVYPYGTDPGRLVYGSALLPQDAGASAATLYFVNVGHDGSRTTDPTTKPSVVFAGGIHT